MRPRNVMICAAALVASGLAQADGAELAKQKVCLSCHDIAAKRVGPAFKDVAARYAGQKDAPAKLADKIVKGGSGAWGAVPMPANPKVTADEARQLVAWVLSLK